MIYPTSVTILIASPEMTLSDWIEWEIQYSLRQTTRKDRQSHRNGIVCVVQNCAGSSEWLLQSKRQGDGCEVIHTQDSYLPDVVTKNRFNQVPLQYACKQCQSVDSLMGCYISLVAENNFLAHWEKYIENAYKKSQDLDGYNIVVDS